MGVKYQGAAAAGSSLTVLSSGTDDFLSCSSMTAGTAQISLVTQPQSQITATGWTG